MRDNDNDMKGDGIALENLAMIRGHLVILRRKKASDAAMMGNIKSVDALIEIHRKIEIIDRIINEEIMVSDPETWSKLLKVN